MTALASLHREHRLIAQAAQALGGYTAGLERGAAIDGADLARFAAFFGEYADLGHHIKEEDILLPAMVRAGLAWDSGPIAKVREDHEQERYLLSVLVQAVSREGAWDQAAREHLIRALRGLTDFVQAHIASEEASLYAAVGEHLSEAAQQQLEQSLAAFDQRRFGAAREAELEALAAQLYATFSPAEGAAAGAPSPGPR